MFLFVIMVAMKMIAVFLLMFCIYQCLSAPLGCIDYKTSKRYEHNTTFTIQRAGSCIIHTCFDGSIRPSYMRCTDPEDKDKCIDRGDEVTYKCKTKRCVYKDKEMKMEVLKQQCSDKDGACHNEGDFFARTISGLDFNCSCSINGAKTTYACHSLL